MTTADPQVVRRYYERIDDEDYEAVFSLFAEDVTYERPGQANLSGMDEFREFYLEDRPLEDGEHRIHDVVVEGDTAVARGSSRACRTARRSGSASRTSTGSTRPAGSPSAGPTPTATRCSATQLSIF